MTEQLTRGKREERTAASRARILDAAVACLVESGYTGATTLNIQARAGVSRGRLLHHFPSRDQLLVAASRHLAIERIRGARTQFDDDLDQDGGVEPGRRLDRAVEQLWLTFSEPYFWAAVELWTAARTNEELRKSLLPEEREVGAEVRLWFDRFFGPELCAHPRYAMVRDLLFTSMRGVGLTYALEHREPATEPHLKVWKELARTLLDPA
jgi:AcrR family transcriptional regulator